MSRRGDEREDTTAYKVVVDPEEQYSIWPAHRENPLGWNDVGKSGTKQECLDYIKEASAGRRPDGPASGSAAGQRDDPDWRGDL